MFRLLLLWLLVLPVTSFTQDVNALIKKAQLEEAALDESAAFQTYSLVVKKDPANLVALCKCSELCSRIGNRQSEKSKKLDYFNAAKTYAIAALRVNPNSSEANFVMSFAMGRMSLMSTGKERIIAVKNIKQYADNSIRLDPSNFKAYHVLGKWNYEVSNLNSMEKALAKWFFGGLPPASLQVAIANFEKSKSLNPGFVLNYLELARAYKRNDQKNKAIECLTIMFTLPNLMVDDTRVKKEGRELFDQLH